MQSNHLKHLKWVSLVVLIAQTTALVLILRYSRTQKVQGPKYLSSTAVVTAEVIKLVTCLVVILCNNCRCGLGLTLCFQHGIRRDSTATSRWTSSRRRLTRSRSACPHCST